MSFMSTSQNQWGHTVHTHYWNKTSLLIDSTCWVSQHADSGNMLIPSTCGVNQHDELSIMLSQSRCWVNQHAESIDVESINMLNQSTCALNQPVDSIKISWLTVVGRHNPPFSLQGQYHEIFVPRVMHDSKTFRPVIYMLNYSIFAMVFNSRRYWRVQKTSRRNIWPTG